MKVTKYLPILAVCLMTTGCNSKKAVSYTHLDVYKRQALNSVLSSQINSLMGNLKNASVSVGIEDHDLSDTLAGGGRKRPWTVICRSPACARTPRPCRR